MNTYDVKSIVTAAIDAINRGDIEKAVTFTHSECTLNGQPLGREGDQVRNQMVLDAFPDQHWSLDRLIAEGEWVSASYTFTGTFTNKYGDFPPTGKPVTFVGNSLYHVKDRQIVEIWEYIDRLALFQQMGIIPETA